MMNKINNCFLLIGAVLLLGGSLSANANPASEKKCQKLKPMDCYDMGFSAMEKGDYNEAKGLYTVACQKLKVLAACHNLGVAALQQKDMPTAKKFSAIVCDFKTFVHSAHDCYNRGWLAKESGNAAETQIYYKKACLLKEAKGCLDLGVMLDESGKKPESLTYFKKGCDLKNADACNNLGTGHFAAGDKEKATEALKAGCDLGSTTACDNLKQVQGE